MNKSVNVPPHNVEAEQALLCGMLINPARIAEVRTIIEPDDMYLNAHMLIARGLFELGEKADALTLGEWLSKNNCLERPGS